MIATIAIGIVMISSATASAINCSRYPDNVSYIHLPGEDDYAPGTIAYLHCNFTMRLIGPGTSICAYGIWVPALGRCKSTLCLKHTPVTNGTLKYVNNLRYGDSYLSGAVVQVICVSGYYAVGPIFARCDDGGWTSLAECLPIYRLHIARNIFFLMISD